jgi:hypothetical protein
MAQTQAPNADQQALALIQSSGILNPNTTLDKIIDVSEKISELNKEKGTNRGTNIFIHQNFIYSIVD